MYFVVRIGILLDIFCQIFYHHYKMDKRIPDSHFAIELVTHWKRKDLSTRASYVLAKTGISETELASYTNIEALTGIRNCGSQTAEEIWDFMTNPQREVKEIKFEDLIPNE